ncbi:MAG: hypothetical protein P8Z30_17455 [Acidobacteriota bacterium]
MRCDVVRQMVEEGIERPPAVQAHMASCPDCQEYLRQWEVVRTGLVALRESELPEPSIGFTTRVIRRLEDASTEIQAGQQFLDQIGRRFVYGTLMVALMILLALVIPSSGPYRSSGISDSILAQSQVSALSSEQILGVDGIDSSDATDSSPAPAVNNNQGGRGSK